MPDRMHRNRWVVTESAVTQGQRIADDRAGRIYEWRLAVQVKRSRPSMPSVFESG
jgi:hypothetical protein